MNIEHDHRNAISSDTADILEKEIETIEQSIEDLLQELLRRMKKKMTSFLMSPQMVLIILGILFFKIVGFSFTKQAAIKRRVAKLNIQNYKLKRQNKKLQHLLMESKKKM